MKTAWFATLVLLSPFANGDPFDGLLSDDFEGASYVEGAALPSPWSPVVGNVQSEVVLFVDGNKAARLWSTTPLTQSSGGWWQFSGYPAPQCDSVEISFDARVDSNGADDSGAINLGVFQFGPSNSLFSLSLKRTSSGTADLIANQTGTDLSVADVVLATGLSYGIWHTIKARSAAGIRTWQVTLNSELLDIEPLMQRAAWTDLDNLVLLARTFGGAPGMGTEGYIDNIVLNELDFDFDEDGLSNCSDVCVAKANPDQRDTDADGIGNLCDADLNNDCSVNAQDLGIMKSVFFTGDADADFDGDGSVNAVDLGIMKSSFFGSPGPSGVPNVCN